MLPPQKQSSDKSREVIRPKNQKNAGDNQWITTGLQNTPDDRERRDGPGGEDAGQPFSSVETNGIK
ncbi:MAG: hypothetical protein ACOYKJ_04135 [Candidatus Howiella sp.]|jgi:hypothetical protein